MELLQAKMFSLSLVLLVFCCSGIRKTEPCFSLDRIVFYDPPKSVCVTSSHAESEIQLKGGAPAGPDSIFHLAAWLCACGV